MRRRLASLLAVGALLSSMLIVTGGIALAANPAANLDQCANDPAPSPPTDGCNTNANQWLNGNLGASKSIYREGDSVPYRMRFSNLALVNQQNEPISHTVIIEWDTTKGGKHSFDFLTTWDRTVGPTSTNPIGAAKPCLGVTPCANPVTTPIPVDPQVGGVIQIPGVFTMWGVAAGSMSVSSYSYPNGLGFAGDKSARLAISFVATQPNPVLAWAGHIATRQDWGSGNSAISISGSPYHMRLIDLDGAGGNQDRSLSADAVIFPARITIIKNADGATATFTFNGTDFTPNPFTLTDGSTTTNPPTVSNQILTFGNHTVSETSPLPGYKLGTITCTSDMTNTYTPTYAAGGAGGSVSINLEEGENTTCTFNNLEQRVSTTIDKEVVSVKNADDTTDSDGKVDAAGDFINYRITYTNTGNTTLTGVTVTDTIIATLTCTIGGSAATSPFTLTAGQAVVCTGRYTATQADINTNGGGDGEINNTATGDSAQTDPITDSEVVLIVRSLTTTIDKIVVSVKNADDTTDSDGKVDTAGDVINYQITYTNTGNVTLTGVTVTDTIIATLTCSIGGSSATSPFILTPGQAVVCTGSYTVTQTDINTNGGGDGQINNTATGDSAQTDPITDSEVVLIVATTTLGIVKTVTSVKNPDLSTDADGAVDQVGDVIHYQIVVSNDGNTTLTNVTVSDSIASNLDCDAATAGNQVGPFTLAPGASKTCTATYTVTQADLDANGNHDSGLPAGNDVIRNVATADSTQTDPVTDDATVPVDQNPAIKIVKSVSGVTNPDETADADGIVDQAGDVIHYTLTVTNPGNITLTGITVTDSLCDGDPSLDSGDANSDDKLQVTETWLYSCSHVVTQAELDAGGNTDTDEPADGLNDVLRNVATADSDQTDEETDDEDVPVAPSSVLGIVKTVTSVKNPDLSTDADGAVDQVGDVIHYQIVVSNDGNTTLTNVTVSDSIASNLDCDAATAGNQVGPFTLAPGASKTCTATYTVTQADLDANGNHDSGLPAGNDVIRNVATADSTQTDPVTDDATVPVDQNPAIKIVKSVSGVTNPDETADADGIVDQAGDVIHYTLTVTNPGNITLTGITVTDSLCDGDPSLDSGDANSDDKLQVTETWLYSCSHVVTQAELDAGGNTDTDEPADGLNDVLRNVATADSDQTDEETDDEDVPVVAQGAIDTNDYFVPQDVITLSDLTTDAAGDLYVALRIDEECDAATVPAWDYTWEGVGNGEYKTVDVGNVTEVHANAVVRWCTSYSGDDHNATIPLSERGEVAQITFDPVLTGIAGFAIPSIAWALWSLRRRREEKHAA